MKAITGYQYQCLLGKNLRRLRLESGISQREMEKRYGISRTYLNKLEKGKHSPTIETLRLLAKAYGVAPSMMFLDENDNEIQYI